MWCTNCGYKLEENAEVCSVCGTKVRKPGEIPEEAIMQEQQAAPVQEESQVPEESQEQGESQEKGESEEQDREYSEEMERRQQGGGEKNAKDWRRILKRHWAEIALALAVLMIIAYIGRDKELEGKIAEYEEEIQELLEENEGLEGRVSELSDEVYELENGAGVQLVEIRNAFDDQKWRDVIELAEDLHDNYNGSEEDKEAQELAKQSKAKIDEAEAAEEAKRAQGYETGITYDQLSRTPDDFKWELVKYSGKVVQVMEGDYAISIRLAINDNSETVIYGYYQSDIVSKRILEGDHITVYGRFEGIETYESITGKPISIPKISIDKIDQ